MRQERMVVRVLIASICLVACKARAPEAVSPPRPTTLGVPKRAHLDERWSGTVVLPNDRRLDLLVKLTTEDDAPVAEVTIPSQGLERVALRDVSADGRLRRFTLGPPNPRHNWARFTVAVSEDGSAAHGWLRQGGGEYRVAMQALAADSPDRVGFDSDLPPLSWQAWRGQVALDASRKLRFTVRLSANASAVPVGQIDLPAQDVGGRPLHDVAVAAERVAFAMRPPGVPESRWAAFEWRLTAGGQATGTMTVSGRVRPLTASRVVDGEEVTPLERPQHPKPPFPYAARDVKVESTDPGVTLAGTLTVPEGAGPHPAAVLLTGSGPQDRDETLFGHKPFLVLADHLSRRGIAVLRLDDRGFAGSTGDLAIATPADFATDARAAVAFLASQPEVDPRRVGLIGHSEGGLVAAMVAGDVDPEARAAVAWVVLLESVRPASPPFVDSRLAVCGGGEGGAWWTGYGETKVALSCRQRSRT